MRHRCARCLCCCDVHPGNRCKNIHEAYILYSSRTKISQYEPTLCEAGLGALGWANWLADGFSECGTWRLVIYAILGEKRLETINLPIATANARTEISASRRAFPSTLSA